MSIIQWLKSGKIKTKAPTVPGLPDPGDATDPREAVVLQSANDAVETESAKTPTKRKRGPYSSLDAEQRAKIARFAVDCGVANAARRFSGDSGRKLAESTVRSIRDQYVRARKASGTCSSIQIKLDK